ncbi:MAG: TrkA family potassium uptake protein [Firmicutes bacterium]|nr:TrkA family potassium uptake protein [Bacillota bacterium]
MRIAIAGGGKVGYYLAKTLMEEHHVTLIDKDEALCQELAEDLGVTVVAGDAAKLRVLEEGEIQGADVFVAATGRDEANLIASQIAQYYLRIGRVIARVNNPRNEPIFQALGVPIIVSSTAIIAQLIQQEVAAHKVRSLLTFNRGNLVLVELDLERDAPVVGKSLVDIAPTLPRNSVLVTVIRGSDVIIPRGDTVLRAFDRVLAIATVDTAAHLRTALVGR